MIRLHVVPDAVRLGRIAAAEILDVIAIRPEAVLGLATGGSVEPVYAALGEAAAGSFAHVRGFALDEYAGMDPGDPRSYAATLRRQFAAPLGVDPERVRTPLAVSSDAGERYERELAAAGGVDIQLLGIGRNGHLAFNEPGSAWDSRTRLVDLTEDTRRANARFFARPAEVPRQAVTQGLATIARARRLLLVAHGEEKAVAVAAALAGTPSTDVPASLVQRHPHVTVVLDEAAASRLPGRTHDAVTALTGWWPARGPADAA